MPVEDVFTIKGRGTVVTGRVERGIVKVGEEVEIIGLKDTARRWSRASRCSASCWTRARRATTSARCCAAPRRKTSSAGRFWPSPGQITPHKKFKGEVYVLKKEEGGRHTPFFNGYRPQFYFRTTDVTGVGRAARGHRDGDAGRQHQDGDRADHADRLEEGLRFAIREGGRTVGAGVVTEDPRVATHDRVRLRLIGHQEYPWPRAQESSSRSSARCASSATTRTTKNKRANAEKLELSKFCKFCRKHSEPQGNEVIHRPQACGLPGSGVRLLGGHSVARHGVCSFVRAVALTVEQRSPKPRVGGSNPSCPASGIGGRAEERIGSQ